MPIRKLNTIAIAAGLALASLHAHAFGGPDWQSAHFAGNPLVGTVWTGDGRKVSDEELVKAVRGADFVAVGETHPNPDHHRIQADILRIMIAAGKRPAVILEMVPAALQPKLDQARTIGAAQLGEALDWEKRGWPGWALYQPVAQAALDAGLALKAGDLDREQMRAIGKQGAAALDPVQQARLGLDAPFSEAARDALAKELEQSHCGLLPVQAIAPMVTVQRARDGSLAAAMADAGQSGALLIAGAGHVRTDRAAPAILSRTMPQAKVLAIGLLELEASHDIKDYLADAPFDYVIMTPKAEMTDHCAALKEKFSRPAQ